MDFSARQQTFGISQLQRLIGKNSQDAERFASYAGWTGLTGQMLTMDVSGAINMLIHSIAADFNVERSLVGSWLPGLRTGALITLGRNVDNWSFTGSTAEQSRFTAGFFGDQEKATEFVARLLGCYAGNAKRQMRFHSATDVELLSDDEYYNLMSNRQPRFVIDSQVIASRVAQMGSPLFVGSVKTYSDY